MKTNKKLILAISIAFITIIVGVILGYLLYKIVMG